MPPLKPHPPHDIAATDGWALRANDLVGASSYSPLPLTTAPVWVEAGDAMPEGCDCVLDSDSVDQSARWFRCWRRRSRGRGFAGRAAISPAEPPPSRPGGACCRAIC